MDIEGGFEEAARRPASMEFRSRARIARHTRLRPVSAHICDCRACSRVCVFVIIGERERGLWSLTSMKDGDVGVGVGGAGAQVDPE
jgi:hypothetical protein